MYETLVLSRQNWGAANVRSIKANTLSICSMKIQYGRHFYKHTLSSVRLAGLCMLAYFCHTYVSNVTTLLATQNLLYLHTLLHSRLWAAYNIKAFYTRYSGSDVLCVFGSLFLCVYGTKLCVFVLELCEFYSLHVFRSNTHSTQHNANVETRRTIKNGGNRQWSRIFPSLLT